MEQTFKELILDGFVQNSIIIRFAMHSGSLGTSWPCSDRLFWQVWWRPLTTCPVSSKQAYLVSCLRPLLDWSEPQKDWSKNILPFWRSFCGRALLDHSPGHLDGWGSGSGVLPSREADNYHASHKERSGAVHQNTRYRSILDYSGKDGLHRKSFRHHLIMALMYFCASGFDYSKSVLTRAKNNNS